MNPIGRIRRLAAVLASLAAALLTPPLAAAALGSTLPGAPQDSGLAACAYPLARHDVTAAATGRSGRVRRLALADLRAAGTDYVDLAVQLLTARGTDGYQTVWFYQRLSAACARHTNSEPPALPRSRRCLAPAATWANPRPGKGLGREPGPYRPCQPQAR